MLNALIGYSGFVGGTLLKQTAFEGLYRSTNIGEIEGKSFDTVVCAGAPAQKWIANREPEADREKIEGLIAHLKSVRCKTFILISTVDVFKNGQVIIFGQYRSYVEGWDVLSLNNYYVRRYGVSLRWRF